MKHTHKKQQHRIFLFITTLLLILCAVILFFSIWNLLAIPKDSLPAPHTEQKTESLECTVQTESILELHGTITDATMNTLTVENTDGNTYSFATEGIDITTGETGLMIGNPVTVLYRGILKPNAPVQEAELVSITVTDAKVSPTESQEMETTAPDFLNTTANEILNTMTLEEKIGQMFLARCPQTDAALKVTEYHLGGYILFGQDFSDKTKEDIMKNIQSYQDAANIPLFIGVDEEGGTVNRVSKNPKLRAVPFWSPQDLFAQGGFDLIREDTKEKSDLLHSLGINLNFAPVCDISQNPNDFIYERSFGQDAVQTSEYVQTVVSTMSENQMGSVLKHFPGYGNNTDTHTGIAYDDRSYETFQNSDFLPFQAGIDSGAGMVLVSHNVIRCMDENLPASLSLNVHNILREELGFTGVIITDDLAMDGVRNFAQDTEIAVQAVLAGNDMLCCTNFEEQFSAVLEAVHSGVITEERIDESVLRILQLKISLDLVP